MSRKEVRQIKDKKRSVTMDLESALSPELPERQWSQDDDDHVRNCIDYLAERFGALAAVLVDKGVLTLEEAADIAGLDGLELVE